MNWFILALVPPILYSVGNLIDKYLISRFIKDDDLGPLIIISGLIGAPLMFLIPIFKPDVLSVSIVNGLILLGAGVVFMLYLYPYFYSLRRDDASIVIPLFQTIPVFGYILGLIFLHEVLTWQQIGSGLLILSGSIGLTIDWKHLHFKKEVFWAMLLASLLVATGALLFKFGALAEDFWAAVFWESVSFTVIGVMLMIFVKRYRQHGIALVRQHGARFIGVNLLNEIVNLAAGIIFGYAALLAPLALVQIVSTLQALIILVLGLLATLLWPMYFHEQNNFRILLNKFFFIVLIIIGAYFMTISS